MCTPANADICDKINDAEFQYSNLYKNEMHLMHVKSLQIIIGVSVDGKWGDISEFAYNEYISKCKFKHSNDKHIIKNMELINKSVVTDYFVVETFFEQFPYTKCVIKKIPIYQNQSIKNDDIGSFVGGAIIGGIIGKVITKDDGGATVGAILGGAIANEGQKNKLSQEIVGYKKKEICSEKLKTVNMEKEVYSHSSIDFNLNGKNYSSKFVKY